MADILLGKLRPAIATTSQINAVTPESFGNGSFLYDETIDKFKYWDHTVWKPLPAGFTVGFGEQELATDQSVTGSQSAKDTYDIPTSGTWMIDALCFVSFPNTSPTSAQLTTIELRRNGAEVANHNLSMKRAGYVVSGAIKAFVAGPCTMTLHCYTSEGTDITLKSYANHGTIAHWLRVA